MIKNPYQIMFWFTVQLFILTPIGFFVDRNIAMYYIIGEFLFLTGFSMIVLIIPCLKDLYKAAQKLDNKIKGY